MVMFLKMVLVELFVLFPLTFDEFHLVDVRIGLYDILFS